MKTVYYNGSGLLVQDEVFEHYGLSHNQVVQEDMFWNIIDINARIGIAMCKVKLNLKNQ